MDLRVNTQIDLIYNEDSEADLQSDPESQKLLFLRGNIESLQEHVKDRSNVHSEIKTLIRVIKLF